MSNNNISYMRTNHFIDILYSTHNNDTVPQYINEELETLRRISQLRRHHIYYNISSVPVLKQQKLTPYKSEEEFECPLTLKLHKTGYVLPCKHIFSNEILKWNKNTCPCCRAEY
jgi:hypothetical protein